MGGKGGYKLKCLGPIMDKSRPKLNVSKNHSEQRRRIVIGLSIAILFALLTIGIAIHLKSTGKYEHPNIIQLLDFGHD